MKMCTWPVISTVVSKLKDFCRSQQLRIVHCKKSETVQGRNIVTSHH